ncbi:sulfur carrier protein ThiS [Thiomicrorhabdus xiamenensis]|uniref:Sulfur carrier protein ThiS n=1 Tax=Thiomicrorhabdus xiamenensis TaxID=2739063 RepID=A0A7D4SYQ9_9GAMM|nr:sulfur carrier protein ThiS [Thiomicrorhabdus xiamenensis]QKI89264.1 sulfur carrier protein ThiS [Thiomicrorhabdus xiamenensis]
MKIEINGHELVLEEGQTLQSALSLFGARMPYAVMLNEEFVPNSEHEQRILHGGDKVEVVSAIQGG